ncbi:hypothetical protein SDC9_203584 [bioreactor metagenome]|uniref:Uncharacterized protein n=1 Tax=bioreactor metagenome TaxID=1076179 RepID=A0A645IYD2_9ZZZZ
MGDHRVAGRRKQLNLCFHEEDLIFGPRRKPASSNELTRAGFQTIEENRDKAFKPVFGLFGNFYEVSCHFSLKVGHFSISTNAGRILYTSYKRYKRSVAFGCDS